MDLLIHNTNSLNGVIEPPGSKSHTIRALLFATLAHGKSVIHGALDSEDTRTCIDVCKALGASIRVKKDPLHGLSVTVSSEGLPLRFKKTRIHTNNSGITTRFLLPILGLRAQSGRGKISVKCGSQMQQRPIMPLVAALNDVGMRILPYSSRRMWPLRVSGSLRGSNTKIEGTTSQYISALLIALPLAPHDSVITVANLNERPYVEMTAKWLDDLGIIYSWKRGRGKNVFFIKGGQCYKPFTKTIPADFSSASYFLAAAAILKGSVTITNLDISDAQGDKKLIPILRSMGADIRKNKSKILIHGGAVLRGKKINCNDIPDLVPTLAVLGTQARGATTLYSVKHARLKETDRISAMAKELSRMGATIKETSDGLIIKQSSLTGAVVEGYHDHRTIMALAIAGLCAKGKTRIKGAEGVAKTFPHFPDLLRSIGGLVEIKK